MTEIRNGLAQLLDTWFMTFAVFLSYWQVAEAVQPGRQYADPLLPCVACACLCAPLIDAIRSLVRVAWRRWR